MIPPVSDPAPVWASESFPSELSSPAHRLQELADKLEDEGYYAWPITAAGRPEEEILDHCSRLEVDLIAMSTHGRSGLERLLEGSVSEKVLSRSPVAVLLQKPLVIHPAVPEVGA